MPVSERDPDAPWPTYGDCARYFGTHAIDPALPCSFVGQFNTTELGRTHAGARLPPGLLQVFAFTEWDSLGISEVAVRFWPHGVGLERRPHPPTNVDNEREPLRRVRVREILTVPDSYDGPWSEAMTLEPEDEQRLGWEERNDLDREIGTERFGFLGHLFATTGGDPTPDRDWQRLLSVPLSLDEQVLHHIAIKRADLHGGDLSQWRAVWVDMDG